MKQDREESFCEMKRKRRRGSWRAGLLEMDVVAYIPTSKKWSWKLEVDQPYPLYYVLILDGLHFFFLDLLLSLRAKYFQLPFESWSVPDRPFHKFGALKSVVRRS